MNELYNAINAKNLSIRSLAKETGVSKSALCEGLSGKTEMKLESFLAIIEKVYENRNERKQKIDEFILLCEKDLNVRKALGYCQCTGEYSIMQKIIDKKLGNIQEGKLGDPDEKEDYKRINKYLSIYDLYNKRNNRKLTGQELLDELDAKNFSNNQECQVILNILYGLAMYDIPNYRAMTVFSAKIESHLNKVENEFIKICLEMQYKERMAYLKLLENDIENCRHVCKNILESKFDFPIIKASALCCLGESYMLGNGYDILKAETYLKEAIKTLEGSSVSKDSKKYFAFKTTLAFLYIEYGYNLDKIDFDYIDIGELAYYECKFGDRSKGLEIFHKLQEEGKLTAIRLYYLSRIKDDILLMKDSLEKFEKNGNLYYVQLVKDALLKEGVK
ncbi:hypothetical protein BAQ49_11435 [Bacillus proteolyticus]|uniref:Uncharacterized protein n=2 Tax=Bacillus proteolyticus TaxID=2026192 RepID=A0AA44R6N5_9BACI|nr:hypothetical protein BAQ49_11435 [Bacillus proteolyticus]